MKLKRLIGMLLSVCLLSTVIAVPNAAAEETAFEKSDVVVGLGFMESGKNGSFNPDNKVTRAEFAKIVCKLLNTEAQTKELAFGDVDKNSEYYGYISAVCSVGLMSGNTNGNFEPDGFIEINDAYKVMVTALGYKDKAEANGGYPVGYAVTASELGISSGVVGKYMTKGTLAKLIYNTMRTQTATYKIFGSEYELKKDKTLLAMYHNIVFGEGIVTANSRTGIKTTKPAGKSYLEINGEKYIVTDVSQRDLLGYNVEYYAYENSGGDFELVFALPKKTDTVTVSYDDFDRTQSTTATVYYTENDKEKKVSLADNVSVIYNGVYYFEATVADMMPKYGDTTFVDNDSDGKYDAAIVNDYKTMRVGRAIFEDEIIYSSDASESVSTQNCDLSAFTFFAEEKRIDIADKEQLYEYFTANSVIITAESKDGSAMKMYFSDIAKTETLSGKVDDEYFSTETETLRLNPYAKTKMSDMVLGQRYVFYMDAFGNAADFEITNTNADYAFLRKARLDTNKLDGKLITELYTIDGKFITLESTDKITVKQGLSSKRVSPQKAYDMLTSNGETVNQLIIYHKNDDDKLAKIELAAEEIGNIGNDYFSVNWKNEKSLISNHHHVMAPGSGTLPDETSGMYSIGKGTYMTVPTKENLDKKGMYEVRPGSTAVLTSDARTLWLYDVKENGTAAVTLDMGSPVSYDCTKMSAIVVNRIYEMLGNDGETVTAIDGYVNKLPYTYTFGEDAETEAKNLKRGDVIFAWPDTLGQINYFYASMHDGKMYQFDPVECYNNFATFYNSSTTGHAINCRDNTQDLVMYQRFALLGEVSAVVMQDASTYVVEITMKDLDSVAKDGKDKWTIKYRTNNITRTDGSVLICEEGKSKLKAANVRDIRIGDKIYLTSFRNYGDARYGCVIYR